MKRNIDSPPIRAAEEVEHTKANPTSAIQSMTMAAATKFHEYDVLHGRGSRANLYQGNKYFREMVKKRKDEYSSTTNRHMKDLIARQIVATIKAKGGRFLQLEDASDRNSSWSIVDDEVAVEKAKQALRDKPAEKSTVKNPSATSSNKPKEIKKRHRRQSMPPSLSQQKPAPDAATSIEMTDSQRMSDFQNQSFSEPHITQRNLSNVASIANPVADESLQSYRSLMMEVAMERQREAIHRNIMLQQLQSESLQGFHNVFNANTGIVDPRGLQYPAALSGGRQLFTNANNMIATNDIINSTLLARLYPNINPLHLLRTHQNPEGMQAAFAYRDLISDSSPVADETTINSRTRNVLESQLQEYILLQARHEEQLRNQSRVADIAPDVHLSGHNERKNDDSSGSTPDSQRKPKATTTK